MFTLSVLYYTFAISLCTCSLIHLTDKTLAFSQYLGIAKCSARPQESTDFAYVPNTGNYVIDINYGRRLREREREGKGVTKIDIRLLEMCRDVFIESFSRGVVGE